MTVAHVQVIDKFDLFNRSEDTLVAVNEGGAGSGKSKSTAQRFAELFLTGHNLRMLVTRKTNPALKQTAQRMVIETLYEMGFPAEKHLNKTDGLLTFKGNAILFKGLDDREKIKSDEFNYIWMEEATDFTKEDYLQLKLRLRLKNTVGRNRIFLTFNPIDQYHWCITDLVDKAGRDPEIAVLHSTCDDNPFLSDDYRRELDRLIEQDENYYRIYRLGEPGVLRNIIYTNYFVDPVVPPKFDDVFYGLDFGFSNPSALVQVGIRENTVYAKEMLYEQGLTNAALIGRLNSLKHIIGTAPIYCDEAEPARIQEIVNAGFYAYPAQKDIADGIDHVKRYRLHLHPDSVNMLGEIRGYKYREDKDGRVLEEPVKFRDHCMDSLRYAIYTHLGSVNAQDRFVIKTRKRRQV